MQAQPGTRTSLSTAPASSGKPSLLFVDDERAILTALRVVFRSGYDVTVTTDGFEAIEFLKVRKFHVIVSDQRMPGITGVEVLREARDLSPDTVRILLTGHSDTDAIVGAINDVEVHRFLQKPWDNKRLKRVVDEAIALARNFVDEPRNTAQQAPSSEDAAVDRVGRAVVDAVQRTPERPAQRRDAAAPLRPGPAQLQRSGAPANQEKEVVLVFDTDSALYDQTRAEMSGKVEVEHAASIDQVFRALGSKRVGIMICSFDVQSESDRTFLQMLKKEYPFVLVIAACDSTDASLLIELINHTKIFRYIRKPVGTKMLSHYINSAIRLLGETRANRKLLLRQKPEEMHESLARNATAISLLQRFAKVNESPWGRFTAWFRLRE